MRIIAILTLSAFVVAIGAIYPIQASTITLSNGQSCTYNNLSIDPNGTAYAQCAGSQPAPTPAPQPPPAPIPQPVPTSGCAMPSNGVLQTMKMGGTNNYVFDGSSNSPGPQGTIQVFPIPQTWPDGAPVDNASIYFASYIFYSQAVTYYEIAFSPCPGDFEYYKTQVVRYPGNLTAFYPCGQKGERVDSLLSWGREQGIDQCRIPAGAQWYLNWRVVGCPGQGGHTCGQTFGVPRT